MTYHSKDIQFFQSLTHRSVIATMSIPLVMLFTFSGIVYFKLTLNFISLFSLLLALGMLVDYSDRKSVV